MATKKGARTGTKDKQAKRRAKLRKLALAVGLARARRKRRAA
jgi:hypothetical protein